MKDSVYTYPVICQYGDNKKQQIFYLPRIPTVGEYVLLPTILDLRVNRVVIFAHSPDENLNACAFIELTGNTLP